LFLLRAETRALLPQPVPQSQPSTGCGLHERFAPAAQQPSDFGYHPGSVLVLARPEPGQIVRQAQVKAHFGQLGVSGL
jgi:hypothetical protein